MRSGWMILAATMLSSCQTTTYTWQERKACASQKEKIMAEWEHPADGIALFWENHYSPRYDRCFITIITELTNRAQHDSGTGCGERYQGQARFCDEIQLIDAFETSPRLANSVSYPAVLGACRIHGEAVDCAKAANFISEHMKN
jgi:hypothetical protein